MESKKGDSRERELIPVLGKTMKYIDMLVKTQFEEAGMNLTKAQFILMRFLEEGPKPQSALAIITERDKGSLTRLIQSMEKKGLVKRSVSDADQRVNMVEMTSLGQEVSQSAQPVMKKLFSLLSKGISADEQNATVLTLNKIRKNVCAELKIQDPKNFNLGTRDKPTK